MTRVRFYVTCTCPGYILALKAEEQDRICKHAGAVLMTCRRQHIDKYKQKALDKADRICKHAGAALHAYGRPTALALGDSLAGGAWSHDPPAAAAPKVKSLSCEYSHKKSKRLVVDYTPVDSQMARVRRAAVQQAQMREAMPDPYAASSSDIRPPSGSTQTVAVEAPRQAWQKVQVDLQGPPNASLLRDQPDPWLQMPMGPSSGPSEYQRHFEQAARVEVPVWGAQIQALRQLAESDTVPRWLMGNCRLAAIMTARQMHATAVRIIDAATDMVFLSCFTFDGS